MKSALPHFRCLRFCRWHIGPNEWLTIARWPRQIPFPGRTGTLFVSLND